ncbi:sugar O-acetyltransferase [Alteromonas sp. ZYF713]|nr:sugar O-acetyltransferase [Alteromonas sp. ZYF713]
MTSKASQSESAKSLFEMAAGTSYAPADEPFEQARLVARQWCLSYNKLTDTRQRHTMLTTQLKCPGSVQIESTFQIEYALNCSIGKGSFINHNATFLDVCPIKLGNQVLIGPNCIISSAVGRTQIEPAHYPPQEAGLPVSIGHRVWIGANSIICAGVTIGDNAVIGAGSVVTSDIPANAVAFGVPASVQRKITQNTQ